jgi:gliding motility-associated-like protein
MINDGALDSAPFLRNIVIEEVVDAVIVYQLVTPDGDLLNDTWVIDGIEQYPDNTVSLFNRWNTLVYKQEMYDNNLTGWAGNANKGFGKGELPDGTYFYMVNLGDGSDLLEGFLVLKRK